MPPYVTVVENDDDKLFAPLGSNDFQPPRPDELPIDVKASQSMKTGDNLDHLVEWVRFAVGFTGAGHGVDSFRLLSHKRTRRPTVAHPFKQAARLCLFRYAHGHLHPNAIYRNNGTLTLISYFQPE